MRADERSRKIGGIHPDAQAIIEQLQPYNRGQNFASDPLWLLHELSRIDKHRLPHLTLFAHVSTGFGADNAFVESMAITGGGAIEHSAELAQYRARPINPSKKMDMDFSFEFNIAFAQGPPAYGEAAIPLLTSLRNYIIDEVLSPLVCYFN